VLSKMEETVKYMEGIFEEVVIVLNYSSIRVER